jgi:uncharacterized protein
MTIESSSADSQFAVSAPAKSPSGVQTIFTGPNGIRAGWRLLLYLLMTLALFIGGQRGVGRIPAVRAWLSAQPTGMITPGPQVLGEAISVLAVILPVFVMMKIERRPFGVYGLPAEEAFGKRFWQGIPYGFAMMSFLLVLIAAFHGFSLGGISSGGADALKAGILYAIGFVLTGFFEEFGFRGYMQYTLASGIRFWPAAIVLSFLFGAVHLGNPGEAKIGAFMAGAFGLLAVFSLKRTGSLWFAVGMHAAFDWTETFVYGVPDSGMLAQGHLLNSSVHGPNWLSGGTVGPEGSYLVFVVLIVAAIGIHLLFPARQAASASNA